MRRLLGPFRNASALAIVNSHSVADDLESALPGMRIVPLYNAIDVDRFRRRARAWTWMRSRASRPPGPEQCESA